MSKKTTLTLSDKINLIELKQHENLSVKELMVKFKCGKTQVYEAIKNKDKLMEQWVSCKNSGKSKRVVSVGYEQVERDLYRWFVNCRSKSLPIFGPIIQTEATKLAGKLGISDFKASNVLIKGYEAKDIYNADETGLFFRGIPTKSLVIKGDACVGGKKSKDRLTVLMCGSMAGEIRKPLVIGKSIKPRCFKNMNIASLPVTWKSNKKAWMTAEIIEQWLQYFNADMRLQNRNILLFLDNAT
ncbi:tigger transposable element-derived protein 4-like [Metopolophium dirhodum]|uniref:tigger transposable element-derived protein 4-like n=1 Tax=Metopolophium dirhodum TaxID=44670 RepID=UPI00298FA32F|nr:tigger transposable element-derived protein 4-like [Metopolophium dirhodum]